MNLNRYQGRGSRCVGEIVKREGRLTIRLKARAIYRSSDPNGNILWLSCGRGAEAEGFSRNQWVAKVGNVWYVRTPGRGANRLARGQRRIRQERWETFVTKATPEQAEILEAAQLTR